MKPEDFHPERASGRLVNARFTRATIRGGALEQRLEEGFAFIPGPLPDLMSVLSRGAQILLPLHEQAVALLGRLDGTFRDNPAGLNINPWVLYQPLRLREARLSSKIENTIASAAEIAGARIVTSQRSEPQEVRNYINAIERGSRAEEPITESLIRALHSELLNGLDDAHDKFPGQYRPRQVMIGDDGQEFTTARFVPPPPGEVPMLMRDLVEYMRHPPVGMPSLFVAAITHYQFEAIHPFADGNGRLGRMLITLSLCGDSLLSKPLIYPSGYIHQHRQEYYDRLLRVSTHGEWVEWIEYFLRVIIAETTGTIGRLRRLADLRQSYLDRVSDRALGQRFTNAIDFLFEQSVITAKHLHQQIGGTTQTARNYIDIMVERKILLHLQDSGKTKVYFAPEIHFVADED